MKQTSVYFVTFASRDENLISTERYSLTTHRSLKKEKEVDRRNVMYGTK